MTNVVFSVSIGNSPEYSLSQQSWAKWCEKNDVELFILNQEIKPKEEMFYNYQRYYMFPSHDLCPIYNLSLEVISNMFGASGWINVSESTVNTPS